MPTDETPSKTATDVGVAAEQRGTLLSGGEPADRGAQDTAFTDAVAAGEVNPVTNEPTTGFLDSIPEEHRDAVKGLDDNTRFGNSLGRSLQARDVVAARERQEVMKASAEEEVKLREGVAFTPDQTIMAVPPEVYRAQQNAIIKAKARAQQLDKTVPGGRYTLANGTVVDANGRTLEEAPTAANEDY